MSIEQLVKVKVTTVNSVFKKETNLEQAPAAVFRDAALWRYYEQDYVAVKKESDEAFMEVFSREFRKAYERQLRDGLK